MKLPKRKALRLKDYDYTCGTFFVTVCVEDRRPILSRIEVGEGQAPPLQ